MISLVYLLHIDVKMTVESRQYINPPYKITDRDNKADNRHVKIADERSSVFQTIYNKTFPCS